jgi:ribosome-associated heat shock protein Hsp15
MTLPADARQRIDKWLFFARIVKSRTLAAKLANAGKVRVNKVKIDQASRQIVPGDVLTVSLDRRILVLRVLDAGARRGPAAEARLLYEDLTPPDISRSEEKAAPAAGRDPRAGRPTKKERRQIDRFKDIG